MARLRYAYPWNVISEITDNQIDKYLMEPLGDSEGIEHCLNEAVGALSDRYQAIFRARFIERNSYATIGKMFDITASRAQQLIVKIIRELRYCDKYNKILVATFRSLKTGFPWNVVSQLNITNVNWNCRNLDKFVDSLSATIDIICLENNISSIRFLKEKDNAREWYGIRRVTEAIEESAFLTEIIKNGSIIRYTESLYTEKKMAAKTITEVDPKNVTLKDLEFTKRTHGCLTRKGIETLEDLLDMSIDDLMRIRNLGATSLEEIERKLRFFGLGLRHEEGGVL